jgi:hypothetical protein
VPLAHGIGVGDEQRQLVLQQHPSAALQRADHTSRFAVAVGRSSPAHRGSRCALLRRQTVVTLAGAAVEAEGPLVLMGAAALAAAPGASVNPVVHRAADRGAVAAAVGKHLFAALLAEGTEAQAAELLQLVALSVAPFVAADQAGGAVAVGGDAVAGEHLAHHALHRIRRATSCAGAGLQRPSSSMSISGWSMGLLRMRLAMECRRCP